MDKAMKLGKDQQAAFDAALRGENIFITGAGGTGKSEVLKRIIEAIRVKGDIVAVTASTGIAAVRVGGSTIHAFLGTSLMGTRREVENHEEYDLLTYKAKRRSNKMDTLVIDEISMLRADYVDMMDWWLRTLRGEDKPFGGVQVIFVGDFLQLPPVIRREETVLKVYAFESEAWRQARLKVHNLRECFRQDDVEFFGMLSRVRVGDVTGEVLEYFNRRYAAALPSEPTRLYSRNKDVNRINLAKLERLEGQPVSYTAQMYGSPGYCKRLALSCIAEETLVLKVGAPVIFIRNGYADSDMGFEERIPLYVNGQKGAIVDIGARYVEVMAEDGEVHTVMAAQWEYKNADQEVVASMTQIPVKLAWALTTHKAQGMTLDPMSCDIADCFEKGQAYVALSRAKRVEGLSLVRKMTFQNVKTCPIAVRFCEELEAVETGGDDR